MEFSTKREESSLKIKLDGQEYQIYEPSVGDLMSIKEAASDSDPLGQVKSAVSFLVGIGLPEEKIRGLSLKTLNEMISFISSAKKN